ncbi:MAG TPA: hypothetical protein VLA79_05800 [Polyangia bacterium]|nr:hypothetical protein [Polyangia bacterium]
MSCPDRDTLLLDELGELPVNGRQALRAHVESCGRCLDERSELRRVMASLRPAEGVREASSDGAAFSARLLAAVSVTPQERRPPERRWYLGRTVVAGTLAAAAMGAVWLLASPRADVRPPASEERAQRIAGTFAARGAPAAGERLSAEILLVRGGHLQPLAGAAVRRSDALAVRVTNLSGAEAHVMAFAWDAAGEVHWLYPAYLDARTNPRSVPIAAGAQDRLLNDVVQPDAPHAGPLRLVTLMAPSPLTVKDVEARLAETPARQRRTADISSLFPRVIAREWSARWETAP